MVDARTQASSDVACTANRSDPWTLWRESSSDPAVGRSRRCRLLLGRGDEQVLLDRREDVLVGGEVVRVRLAHGLDGVGAD